MNTTLYRQWKRKQGELQRRERQIAARLAAASPAVTPEPDREPEPEPAPIKKRRPE